MVRRASFYDHKVAEVADDVAPVERSPAQWAKAIKSYALANGAVAVGIVRTRDEWLYQQAQSPGKWLIVMAFQMDQPTLAKVPDFEGAVEVMRVYGEGAETTSKVAQWLADQGHRASGACLHPDVLNVIPAAIAAGLGELGKHGSLIHPELGSAIRLGYVFTDLELVEDRAVEFHLDDFCGGCQVCTRACPADAIAADKQWVRGVEKWYVDFDKCLPYFNDARGCGICIARCPFSISDRAPTLVNKLSRRRQRQNSKKGAS